jgi:hypothetical protein
MTVFEFLASLDPNTAKAGGFTTGISSSALQHGVGVNSLNNWLAGGHGGTTARIMGQGTHTQQQIWAQGWRRTS